ncbi:MAG: phosphatase PAP2 family protein [Treponema sp.]|jgi:membrane-associated phospholipid phosphatase|nr:phosphatase PAP2 family protein [Treponema sp.]
MSDIISISSAETLPAIFALYRWGIELIQGIQGIQSAGLTAFVKAFTALGTELLYIPALLLLFWCVNEKKGAHLGFIVILSVFANGFFKDLLKQPRPFALEPSVGLAFEPSYGIPSGHAQLSLCFVLPLAIWAGRSKFARSGGAKAAIRLGAALFILCIAFTRLYLGVHFPTDILAGWLLGGVVLGLWFLLEPRTAPLLETGGLRSRMIAAAAAVIGMNALYPAGRSLGGLFLGFGAGCALMSERFPFSAASGSVSVRLVRYALGLAGGALIYLVLKLAFPGEDSLFSALPYWGASSPYYDLGRFLQYGLLGFWAAALAPRLFLRLGLAEKVSGGA